MQAAAGQQPDRSPARKLGHRPGSAGGSKPGGQHPHRQRAPRVGRHGRAAQPRAPAVRAVASLAGNTSGGWGWSWGPDGDGTGRDGQVGGVGGAAALCRPQPGCAGCRSPSRGRVCLRARAGMLHACIISASGQAPTVTKVA